MKVTDYMIKKWVQAVFVMMAAIILIIFGLQFFDSLPSQAAQFDLYWFLFALFWFAVIAIFTFAIVSIAHSFVGRTSKFTLGDISIKLDELEKRIESGEIRSEALAPGIADASGENIPPPPVEEKGISKKKLAVVIVAVVLVIAAIAIGLMMFVFNAPGSGGATPEQVFDQFINRMNAKDASGVIDQTIYKYSDNRSQLIESLDQSLFSQMGTFNIIIENKEVIDKQALSQEERNNLTSLIDDLEQELGINITDFCVIEFSIRIQTDQGQMNQSSSIPVFLVDGMWYLMMPDFEGGGPNGSSPEDIFNTFIERMNAHDAYGALNLTVWRFDSNFNQIVTDFDQQMFSGSFDMQVSGYDIEDQSSFNQSEFEMRDAIISSINQDYGLQVDDFRLIYYTGTLTNNSGTFPVSDVMSAVQINDGWYLVLRNESQSGTDISVATSTAPDAGNWRITVVGINVTSLPVGDVYLTVNYSNGTGALSMMPLTSWTPGLMSNGVTFNDMTDPVNLNIGDDFVLDGTVYLSGSMFKLTDQTGSDTYCEIYVS